VLKADLARKIRDELDALHPAASFVTGRSIAVLLPCYNEAATIARVVEGFARALPGATIYVYDNNSTDETRTEAAAAGAIVRREPYQGKGHVVRRMFADIDADIYLLADGDLTYDPTAAGRLIDLLVSDNLDMVVGTRVTDESAAYRRGHRTGNRAFNLVVEYLFGQGFTDILSGYRVFSRRFAKSFPAASGGFEIETELSIHALDLKLAVTEVPLRYGARPENSTSKLKTYRDGVRILWKILKMYRALHPLRFFGTLAVVTMLVAIALAVPLLATFVETGLVPRLPTAVLVMGLVQVSLLSGAVGLVLHEVAASRRELKRMRYLDLPSPASERTQ
jgi:glycosyltransferase involved in cell wall biosynthesis